MAATPGPGCYRSAASKRRNRCGAVASRWSQRHGYRLVSDLFCALDRLEPLPAALLPALAACSVCRHCSSALPASSENSDDKLEVKDDRTVTTITPVSGGHGLTPCVVAAGAGICPDHVPFPAENTGHGTQERAPNLCSLRSRLAKS